MSQFDAFLNDMGRHTDAVIADRRLAAEVARAQEIINRVSAERDAAMRLQTQYRDSNAANLALRVAALNALAKVDPTHPLVRDADLRDRITRHAKHTIEATNDWDEVREVGRTFKIPGRG
jgi:hypothetical protein